MELYVDTGDMVENKRIFDLLHSQKGAIEKAVGAPLVLQRLDGGNVSRFSCLGGGGGLLDK